MGKGQSQTPHLATVDALPVPLTFSIKHLLVLFGFGLVCICKGEPQVQEAGEVGLPGPGAWVWRFGFGMDEALAWGPGNGV